MTEIAGTNVWKYVSDSESEGDSPTTLRPTHALAGVRIGEASKPGPPRRLWPAPKQLATRVNQRGAHLPSPREVQQMQARLRREANTNQGANGSSEDNYSEDECDSDGDEGDNPVGIHCYHCNDSGVSIYNSENCEYCEGDDWSPNEGDEGEVETGPYAQNKRTRT